MTGKNNIMCTNTWMDATVSHQSWEKCATSQKAWKMNLMYNNVFFQQSTWKSNSGSPAERWTLALNQRVLQSLRPLYSILESWPITTSLASRQDSWIIWELDVVSTEGVRTMKVLMELMTSMGKGTKCIAEEAVKFSTLRWFGNLEGMSRQKNRTWEWSMPWIQENYPNLNGKTWWQNVTYMKLRN